MDFSTQEGDVFINAAQPMANMVRVLFEQKPRWTAEDMDFIEACLNDESRTYSSVQLSRKLKEAGLVNLSSDRLRDLIKEF